MWCRIVIRGWPEKIHHVGSEQQDTSFSLIRKYSGIAFELPFWYKLSIKKRKWNLRKLGIIIWIYSVSLWFVNVHMFQTSPPPHPHRYPYPTPNQITNRFNLFCPINHKTSQYRTRIFPTFPIEVTQREWSKIAKFRWTFRAVKGNKPCKPGKEINEINQKLWIKGWYKYDDIFTWQGVLRSSTFFIVYMYTDGIFKKAVRS